MYYSVLSIGLNDDTINDKLSYAEDDALDIKDFYLGDFAPAVEGSVTSLIGETATKYKIITSLNKIESKMPDFFVFYFSGHGNKNGIHVYNDFISYDTLVPLVVNIAKSSIIILDTCFAANFKNYIIESVGGLGGSDPDWVRILQNVKTGTRLMFSTGTDRTSVEGGKVENGHFTHCLLEALSRSEGDLRDSSGGKYISDRKVFDDACYIMRKELFSNQMPVSFGLTGDMPMAMANE